MGTHKAVQQREAVLVLCAGTCACRLFNAQFSRGFVWFADPSLCSQLVVPEAEIDMAVTMPTKPPAALLTASKQTDMSKEI